MSKLQTYGKLRRRAKAMREEMEMYGGLEVTLVTAPDEQHSGHKVRIVANQNAPWYRRFAALYTNCRGIGIKQMKRPRTFIRRDRTMTALQRIVEDRARTVLDKRLIDFIDREIQNERNQNRERSDGVNPFEEFGF